jgi:hypothetical protein
MVVLYMAPEKTGGRAGTFAGAPGSTLKALILAVQGVGGDFTGFWPYLAAAACPDGSARSTG